MQVLIINDRPMIAERNDITPLLGMDWMNTFRMIVRSEQLAEKKQAEQNKKIRKLPDLFINNTTIKNSEKNTIETRTLSENLEKIYR